MGDQVKYSLVFLEALMGGTGGQSDNAMLSGIQRETSLEFKLKLCHMLLQSKAVGLGIPSFW